MSVQSVSLNTMFGWVVDSFKVLKNNFANLTGASAITLALGFLLCVPMWVVMFANLKQQMAAGGMPVGGLPMSGDLTMFYSMYGITIVVGLLTFPPMLVGWFRLCQDIDQGRPIRALDILNGYKDRELWIRSVSFALIAFILYVAVFVLFGFAFWGVISDFMQQAAVQQAAAISGTPYAPSFPLGFFLAYFCFLGVALVLNFVYMLGFGEVALRSTPVVEAMQLALLGVLKNLLKLVVFLFLISSIAGIAIFIFAIVLGIVAALLSLIHPAIGLIIAVLVYIPFLLCLYPLMFAGSYFLWKSVLGADSPETANSTLSV
jgi:hypothetical protein